MQQKKDAKKGKKKNTNPDDDKFNRLNSITLKETIRRLLVFFNFDP